MNEEVLVKTYNIDNKDYVVVNELDINNVHYYYLSCYDDPNDVLLQKLVNGYLVPLDDESEIMLVLKTIGK